MYANQDITNTYFTLRFCWTPCLSNLENILDTTHFLIAQKPMGLCACKLIEYCCYLQLFCKNNKIKLQFITSTTEKDTETGTWSNLFYCSETNLEGS